MPPKTLSSFLLAALAAASALADPFVWESRRAIQENHNANLRGFQNFTRTLFAGMENSGGAFNGGGGIQLPPASQVVMPISNALNSDMSPLFRNQLDQAAGQLIRQNAFNPDAAVQQLMAFAQQLGNNPDPDSQRGALRIYLGVLSMQGASSQQIIANLSQMAAHWDRNGVAWPRTGHFGAILNQLCPRQDFTPALSSPFGPFVPSP